MKLAAGTIALLVETRCPELDVSQFCNYMCPIAEFIGGLGAMRIAARAGAFPNARHHVLASVVASLTAAISCAGLGMGSLIAALVAVIAGTAVRFRLHARA